MENYRCRALGNNRLYTREIDLRFGLVQAVRGADGRREAVDPGGLDEFDAPIHWDELAFDVATHIILDSADCFEFAFNAGAVLFGEIASSSVLSPICVLPRAIIPWTAARPISTRSAAVSSVLPFALGGP